MDTKRAEIKTPYKTYTGKILNKMQCETYNVIQREINRWVDEGREIPEHLLNASHQTMSMLANL